VRRRALLLIATGPTLVVGYASGCGPSVQSIHEGTVRFEHCYRLDLDPAIAPTHRLACWRDWSQTHAYGQTRDRIEYARRRIQALAAGERETLELQVATATGPEPQPTEQPEAPAPTSAHAPPPPTVSAPAPANDSASGPADAGPKVDAATGPFADCLKGCNTQWRDCEARCSDEPGTRERTCSSCTPDFRVCARRCVE